MNDPKKFDEDLLRKYISPERIEKAPEGFTVRIMTQIRTDTRRAEVHGRFSRKSLVPLVSAVITFTLIIATVLLPGNGNDSAGLKFFSFIRNIDFSLPPIDLTPVLDYNIPGWLTYVFISILILSLFDRLLSGFFHREK
ncbi:MAG TPA: hypothetical protein VMW32_07150 [Bacteroidales bacterium]|nr:hypothetical protein [Bacteroidales bacterium]